MQVEWVKERAKRESTNQGEGKRRVGRKYTNEGESKERDLNIDEENQSSNFLQKSSSLATS